MLTTKSYWTYYSMFNLYEVECCESGVICCSGDNPTTPHTELINVFSSYFSAQSTTTTTTTLTTITTTTPSTTTTTTISSQPCPTEEIFGTYSEGTELLRHFCESQISEGQELIRLYYEWSPAIVKAMEKDEEFKEEMKEMIDGVFLLLSSKVTKKNF